MGPTHYLLNNSSRETNDTKEHPYYLVEQTSNAK